MAKAQPPLRNLYPQIISFPVLLAAFRKAAKGKRRDIERSIAIYEQRIQDSERRTKQIESDKIGRAHV